MMKWAALAPLFVLMLPASAPAADREPSSAPATVVETRAAAPANGAPAAVRRPARPLSPLAVAMAGIIETEKASMAALKARLAAARDLAATEALHREIEQLKRDTEVQLLAVQAAHHRQAGRTAVADQLEAAIRSLREPQRAPVPATPAVSAPAPASSSR